MLIVKRVEVMSLAKIMTVLYSLLGLALGGIFSLIFFLGKKLPAATQIPGSELSAMAGIASVIVFPLLYGFVGFLAGVFTATFFNLACRWVGGLKIQTE